MFTWTYNFKINKREASLFTNIIYWKLFKKAIKLLKKDYNIL